MVYYEPEIGQSIFGVPWLNYMSPKFIEKDLRTLSDLIDSGYIGYNYGSKFKNAVFEMNDYYWGECTCGYDEIENEWYDEHAHKNNCYQKDWQGLREKYAGILDVQNNEIIELCTKHNIPYNDGIGCAVHCTCDYEDRWTEFTLRNWHKLDCSVVVANFKYGELEIKWYKYIGRGMSSNRPITKKEWNDIFIKCTNSLKKDKGD